MKEREISWYVAKFHSEIKTHLRYRAAGTCDQSKEVYAVSR